MIHYVSEQIALAENGNDQEKTEAKQRCFETILKLWQHRFHFPNSRYPFKGFEAIFETLNRLDPDQSTSYYFDNSHFQKTENDNVPENPKDEALLCLNLALSIDEAARVLIDLAIRQAATNLVDETTKTWLKKGASISDNSDYDISIITNLIEEFDEGIADEAERQQIRRWLLSRIEKLDRLVNCSKSLHNNLNEILEKISDSDSDI